MQNLEKHDTNTLNTTKKNMEMCPRMKLANRDKVQFILVKLESSLRKQHQILAHFVTADKLESNLQSTTASSYKLFHWSFFMSMVTFVFF